MQGQFNITLAGAGLEGKTSELHDPSTPHSPAGSRPGGP
jgi:hypothetical protein